MSSQKVLKRRLGLLPSSLQEFELVCKVTGLLFHERLQGRNGFFGFSNVRFERGLQPVKHFAFLIVGKIFSGSHEVLPLVGCQEYGAHGNLCFEAQFTRAWEESIAPKEAYIL
jgi:hypothetical protein